MRTHSRTMAVAYLLLLIIILCLEPAQTIMIKSSSSGEQIETVSESTLLLDCEQPRDTMPAQIHATLVSRRGTVDLHLQPYDGKLRKPGRSAERGEHAPTYDIPVYTRRENESESTGRIKKGSHGFSDIGADEFPRLYANRSRNYKDDAHQASFLVIYDVNYDALKFLGSFIMGDELYLLQPLAPGIQNITSDNSGNTSSLNIHAMEKFPSLEYSADRWGLFLMTANSNVTLPSTESRRRTSASDKAEHTSHSSGNLSSNIPRENHNSGFQNVHGEEGITDLNNMTIRPQGEESITNLNNTTIRPQREGGITDLNKATISPRGERTISDFANVPSRQDKHWLHSKFFEHPLNLKSTQQTTTTATTTTAETSTDPFDDLIVEVFFVCDFLCYKKFQKYYGVTDPVSTKSISAQYFAYVRDFHEAAYGALEQDYPELNLAVGIRVVGLYIATQPDDHIIGDYVIGDRWEIDSTPSIFEFAIWVEDTLKPGLRADHYVLVTGYDLSGESSLILGQVSNIPSVCQVDSVSMVELWLPLTASVMAHELGHSLGAEHDGLTNGFCLDEQQFLMAAIVGGAVPAENVGNSFRLSNCSALFFKAALPDRECLRHEDFQSRPLPNVTWPVGQSVTLDGQCAALVNRSTVCRENITRALNGSWDGICSNNLCRLPNTPGDCFEMTPLQFTSCGNKRWCVDGLCVEDLDAPEKPVDCPAGDSADLLCDARLCRTPGGYDKVTRFIKCCQTCQPLKTERFVLSNTP